MIQFHTLYNKICGMLYSLNCFVDSISSGLIGILPDSTAGLLRFQVRVNPGCRFGDGYRI